MYDHTQQRDGGLLQPQRRERILEQVQESRQVYASDLAEKLGVSTYTIRRDLDEMAEAGLLERVHGGAVLRSSTSRTFDERQHESLVQKRQSAHAALALLKPNQIVVVDGGSTAAIFAESIPMNFPATFVTHAPYIAMKLIERSPAEVITIGGRLDPLSRASVGSKTVDSFRSIAADLCILGVWGLSVEGGIVSPYYEESLVRKTMIESSQQVVGLAIGSKLGTNGAFTIGPITALTHLSVESGVEAESLRPYAKAGIKVLRES